MDDLISRQDAISVLNGKCKRAFNLTCGEEDCECAEYMALRDLPSAQQWIPCSERMPECDYTDVLICVHDKRKGCENDFYVIQAYTVGKHWEPTLHVDMTDLSVVAWMPLPEPYREEDTNNE